jgi:hypothetical protein
VDAGNRIAHGTRARGGGYCPVLTMPPFGSTGRPIEKPLAPAPPGIAAAAALGGHTARFHIGGPPSHPARPCEVMK